jgi:hypothetical protein
MRSQNRRDCRLPHSVIQRPDPHIADRIIPITLSDAADVRVFCLPQ